MRSFSRRLVLALVLGVSPMAVAVAQDASPAHVDTVKRIMDSPVYKKAVETVAAEHDRWVDEVIKLTEIEAPPFKEQKRAQVYADMFKAHTASATSRSIPRATC